jgi:hypothetical protein
MPGGLFDSSTTRVAPVFDQLRGRDGDWVRELLLLAEHGSVASISRSCDLTFIKGYWGDRTQLD